MYVLAIWTVISCTVLGGTCQNNYGWKLVAEYRDMPDTRAMRWCEIDANTLKLKKNEYICIRFEDLLEKAKTQ